jgi:hypothetical protein
VESQRHGGLSHERADALTMNADLERLIRLQDLDTTASNARSQIAETPARKLALEARLAEHEARVASAHERLGANQAARRETDKNLAAIQTRLANFKNQLMLVKTNKEYQAMQKEIATAEQTIQGFEDVLLEGMLQADEIEKALAGATQALDAEKRQVAEEQAELEREQQALEKELERTAAARQALVQEIEPRMLALFESICRGRGGIALTEARDGLCNVCHVRLRPQVYNEVIENESIHRCENCQRILYFMPSGARS